MRPIAGITVLGGLLCGLPCASSPALAAATLGSVPYVNHRDPPPYLPLSGMLAAQYALGHAVCNTDFLAVGTPGAGRRSGLGPLFDSTSCDECHNEGAHGRGLIGDGRMPSSMVVQMEAVPAVGSAAAVDAADPPGDPVYGHVLSPAAVEGFTAEGQVVIHYHTIQRTYPDGSIWTVREPTYELTHLNYGPLAENVVIKPRLAPALFGLGLLENVPTRHDRAALGRFGWQAKALSLRDQTTSALARDMGVTSTDRSIDDCTEAETRCLRQRHPETPEMSDELLAALMIFQKWLAVPENPMPRQPEQKNAGLRLFKSTGCSGCHWPKYKIGLVQPTGQPLEATIAPYTDLAVHDLGPGLAAHDLSGAVHATLWRTAPLWGMGYRLSRESRPTFLHDGRARSVEEAVLWHDGEAAVVRERFAHLSREKREQLLRFVGAL